MSIGLRIDLAAFKELLEKGKMETVALVKSNGLLADVPTKVKRKYIRNLSATKKAIEPIEVAGFKILIAN